jgi:predicted regulator of Ras-like GTPase activity (Roadblock/LC7/MglB family)
MADVATLNESLHQILSSIRKIDQQMYGSAIYNQKGMAIAQDIGEAQHTKALGAMMVGFLGTAQRISSTLMENSPITQTFFQTGIGTIYIYSLSNDNILAVIAGNDAPQGLIDWVIRDSGANSLINKLNKVLQGS